MNALIQQQTNRELRRLGVVLIIFCLMGGALAATIRYRQMLDKSIADQQNIVRNLAQMRTNTEVIGRAVADFERQLPPDYRHQSPEILLYTRLDQLKQILQGADLAVQQIEHKDGAAVLAFSASLSLKGCLQYEALINRLGLEETRMLPLFGITGLSLETMAPGSSGLLLKLEGHVQVPEPQSGEAS